MVAQISLRDIKRSVRSESEQLDLIVADPGAENQDLPKRGRDNDNPGRGWLLLNQSAITVPISSDKLLKIILTEI